MKEDETDPTEVEYGTVYVCVNDAYTPEREAYQYIGDFAKMCKASLGTSPYLIQRDGIYGGTLTKAWGTTDNGQFTTVLIERPGFTWRGFTTEGAPPWFWGEDKFESKAEAEQAIANSCADMIDEGIVHNLDDEYTIEVTVKLVKAEVKPGFQCLDPHCPHIRIYGKGHTHTLDGSTF